MVYCATNYFVIGNDAVGCFERETDGNTLLHIGHLKSYRPFYFETPVTSCFGARLPLRVVEILIQSK